MRERESEREREKERESERERERPNTKIRQKNLPRQFSRLLTPVPSLSVFHGNLPQEICGASSLMFYNGREIEREREKERESERDREREREREREKERERDRILRCIWTANRWRRGKNQAKKFTRQFSRLLTPAPSLSVFHGNLPQEICDTTSPMFIMGNLFSPHGESTSWNFPAKIKNSLRPIPSFDMMSKFPGSDHSSRRRYVAKLLAER